MKIYQIKACEVNKCLDSGSKFHEDCTLDVFVRKEDAEKAIEFYKSYSKKYESWVVSYEDIEIKTTSIYESYEDFKMDMEEDF